LFTKDYQHSKFVDAGKKSSFRLFQPQVERSLYNRAFFLKSLLTQAAVFPTLAPVPVAPERQYGEVSEWLKEHAWKVCIRQRIGGSNPPLTAIFELRACTQVRAFFLCIPRTGGMRTPDRGSTAGAASWTDRARSKRAARRASEASQSPPHRHI
jgi:hypothetical protein